MMGRGGVTLEEEERRGGYFAPEGSLSLMHLFFAL